MAHGFNVNADGSAAFVSARVPAWHKLGEVVEDLMNWKDACERVMPWEVIKEMILNPLTGEITKFYGLYRNDTCDLLSVVSDSYEVVQPWEMFAFIDSAIGAEGFHYETAGVLGNGEKIFTTANVAMYDVLGSGDVHKTYMLGVNSYDGSQAEAYKLCDTRVVCQNTLSAALRENGTELKFRHTKNMRDRKMDAMQFLHASLETTATIQQKMEILARRKMSVDLIGQATAMLFDLTGAKDITEKKAAEILTVEQLFEENDNNAFPQFRGTAYNYLNAVTEFTDHFKTAENEKQRAYSAIFGPGNQLKQRGVDLVLELTKHAETINGEIVYSYASGAAAPAAPADNGELLNNILDQV